MPYRKDQVRACYAQANRKTGKAKAKALAGCKKMTDKPLKKGK